MLTIGTPEAVVEGLISLVIQGWLIFVSLFGHHEMPLVQSHGIVHRWKLGFSYWENPVLLYLDVCNKIPLLCLFFICQWTLRGT